MFTWKLAIQLTFSILLFFVLSTASYAQDKLKLCVADSTWFPFIIIKKEAISGVYIDILIKSSKPLGYTIKVDAIPWKRCLHLTKTGQYDGIAGVSYQQSRTEFLSYPKDINSSESSKFQLSQVDYVIVTHSSTKFSFNGNVQQLPSPIRSPLGFSIGKELEALGLEVDNAALNDDANLKKLLRDKSGSVILIREMAHFLINNNPDLLIHPHPLKSKSYFLAFSKRTELSKNEKIKLWEGISKVRDDKAFIRKTLESYHHEYIR